MSKITFDLCLFQFPKLPDEVNSIILSYISIPRTIYDFYKMIENVNDYQFITEIKKINFICLFNPRHRIEFIDLFNKILKGICKSYGNKIRELNQDYILSMELMERFHSKMGNDCKYILQRFKFRLYFDTSERLKGIIYICRT